VLVQTFSPEHPAIAAALRHDYLGFAAGELPTRAALNYPPFSTMVRLVVRGPVQQAAGGLADELGQRLRAAVEQAGLEARVLGPAPAPISKLRGKYRFQIQAQARDGEGLRAAVGAATTDLAPVDEVQWMADVDPLDMM
jgi:primosomal protein N' (replication factor Y)